MNTWQNENEAKESRDERSKDEKAIDFDDYCDGQFMLICNQ